MNYLPLLKVTHPPASAQDIARVEAALGARLPESFKALLAQSDGGEFSIDGVRIKTQNDVTILDRILSVRGTATSGILQQYEMRRSMDRIPVRCCPIGRDPGGNLFILSLEPASYGRVYFWDHDNEPHDGGDDLADFPNMHELAPDFERFVLDLEDFNRG
ncbi:SMI1/KNR4 family protein [Bradyrhizobium xenonodulans]|uniref:SMI1/KNR4 family protein n=1 Tax=Bradyrhizobium xenonodulans TaxID=2736875 RepID=A0ABY7MU45_9BRAD|nr:SMI1/KNR4 family protein [Bradyrhizobium xenonodulans]WBL81859.1 SMI1/KNR4 family protein [Bradyrhizobium xenonodulans]